jgi:hypothetical protein
MTEGTRTKKFAYPALIAAVAFSLFVATMSTGLTTAVAASEKHDPKGDSPLADFDIRKYGVAGNSVYVQVYGKAGQTLPEEEHAAYAYVVWTDTGIYASDSHEAQHADDENIANKSWHGHKLEINNVEVDGEILQCITEVEGFRASAKIAGTHVFIDETGATQVFKAATVELDIMGDPDNPDPNQPCIAAIVNVFDEAGELAA